jgi:outer membrane protein assembly factor BamB
MSSPVASGEFVYAATFAGTVVKLEQATGKFRYAIRARATSAPVVLNAGQHAREQIYYTRRVDNVPAAGTPTGDATKAEPVAAPAESIIRMDDNDPKTKYATPAKKAEYLNGKVQTDSNYGSASKSNDAANGFGGGAPLAAAPDAAYMNIGQNSVSSMQAFQGSRVLHLGARNVNTMGDEILATDSETGKKLWSFMLDGDLAKTGGALATAPLSAGDSVLVATLSGKIMRIDPASGKVAHTYEVGAPVRSQPVAVDGWIYVGTEDGKLFAVDTGDHALTGWAMWGADAARTGLRQ